MCVRLCALRLYPATRGWAVRCGCVCLGSDFGCAPQVLAGVLGCECACVRASLVHRHSWLGCASWVCVLGLGFRLRPATPGWGVGVCVFVRALRLYPATPGWGVRCGLGSAVCLSARSSAAPCHSWQGCWRVYVLVCTLRLYPATPGWGVWCGSVCLGSGYGCAPPVLAGVVGCACLCARSACTPPVLAGVRGVCVCVLGLGFRLRPATLGWGVGVCMFLCALCFYPATPSWGVGVGVCAWARVLAATRQSWLGCWAVRVCVRSPLLPSHSWLGCAVWACVLGLGFWLRPVTPGWGVGVSVGLCARSACTPPLVAGVCGVVVCVWVRASVAPRHSWLGCWGVRVCVRAPLLPRHSWLGCAAWVCVLPLGFRLRPAPPGWGVGMCVFVCALRL